jgi:RNA-directed DNA polymerase
MILEPIYEQDFYECSYGFRPGHSAHDCVKAIYETLCQWQGGYIIDADIRKCFDTIDRSHLREILSERVHDGVITRLVGKWLNAGIMEKCEISYEETGTPQGGVASPLLANVYLNKVLDEWFVKTATPRLEGKAKLFRFADDFVIICNNKKDSERLMDVLPKRFLKYGLQVHPDKTKRIDFNRPKDSEQKRQTFSFLGFTFYWGKSRKGRTIVKLKTAKNRLARSAQKLWELCRRKRHEPIQDQQKRLNKSLTGHYNYYGVSFNSKQIDRLHFIAAKTWWFWLNRRSQRRNLNWDKFNDRILKRFPLIAPRIKVKLFNSV